MGSLEDKIRESREKAQEGTKKEEVMEETVTESTLQDVVERSRRKIESELEGRLAELEEKGSEDVKEEEDEVPDEVVFYHEAWNVMIEHLREARRIWEEQFKGIARGDVDTFRGAAAKALSVSRRGGFDMFLSKLLDFWRTIGGLDNLGVDLGRSKDDKK